MDSPEIQHGQVQVLAFTTISATLIFLVVQICWKQFCESSKKLLDKDLPPLADTGGGFQSLRMFVGHHLPFDLLSYSRSLNSSIFRVLLPMGKFAVVVGDADVTRRILGDPENKKNESYRWARGIAGGENFFTEKYGPRVAHVRKSVLPAFAPARVERMINICRVRLDERIKSTFESLADSGEPFDIALEMKKFTTKFIVEAAFSYIMSDEEVDTILESFDITCAAYGGEQALSLMRAVLGRLHPGVRRARQASSTLQSFVRKLLQSYREDKNSPDGTIIALIDADKDYNSDEERVRDLVAFLFGGYETTSIALSFAFLELAQQPNEQRRLYEDLIAQSTNDDRLRSTVLQNVKNETLRLHPPAIIFARLAGNDIRAGPYIIPKGTNVLMTPFIMQRNSDVYDDPDSFKLSRWDAKKEDESAGPFMPFSYGRRGCIGRVVANAEIDVIISELCVKYEFIVAEKGKCDYCITHKTSGTRLKIQRRAKK